MEDGSVFSYNVHVKEKLIAWKADFEAAAAAQLNYSAIAQKMERDFHIQTSPQKISAMFDSLSDREVKLQEVAALCQMFHIPLADICEYPNAPASGLELSGLVKHKKAQQTSVRPLSNRFYEGDYYCYYFRPKHYQDRLKPVENNVLEESLLNIQIEKGRTVVTLKEMKTATTFYGEPMPSFTLTGNLYHFENTSMAYSFITDPAGRRAMALMFTYLELSGDIRYYMTAGMMTFAANQTHRPLFQKMAMFRERQNYQETANAEVLRGILALNTGPVILDEETLEKLFQEDPAFRRLAAPEKALKKCYLFSEAAIRSDSFFLADEHEKMQKMLALRKNSLLPAHEVVFEQDYFADFIKQYQIAQIKDRGEAGVR